MERKTYIVKCLERNFICIEFKFNYSNIEDKKLLDELISSGKELATKVNPVLARDASHIRNFETILRNAIAGIVSEWCWRYWLNLQAREKNISVRIEPCKFETATKQINIMIHYPDRNIKDIEVRSSFPYTGLENGVCRVFDILGWYVNPIKSMEVKKDYYVRALFPFSSSELWERIKSESFTCYLTGGATLKLLQQSEYAKDKELIPFDDIGYSTGRARYRVIEPIVNGYDTTEITKYILEGKE